MKTTTGAGGCSHVQLAEAKFATKSSCFVKKVLLNCMLLLCALIVGSSSAWGETKSGSWGLTSSSSDWTQSNCTTYFSQPYGMKQKDAYIVNSDISDFSTVGITAIKIGVKSLQNGATSSVLTVYLVDEDGEILGSGQTITPVNANSASSTTYQYVTFTSNLAGATGCMVKCTTFGKNILVNGVNYEITYSASSYTITAQSNNNTYGTVSLTGSVITGSPASGSRYASPAYTVTTGTATVSQDGNAFTVTPSSDCTITINFEAIPTHTATFSINGNTDNSDVFAEGADITFPDDPSDINGKTFVGWVASPIVGSTDSKPSFIASATMGASDVIYYAVFASSSTDKDIITDKLTTSTFGSPSTYSNWSNKKATGGSDAVYMGNSTTNNNSNIQMRSTDNSSIMTTTSGGKAKKVTVSWNSSTVSGRTLDVYGKNTAYNAYGDLYSAYASTQGTKLGSIVYGTSTQLTITGDYEYIGLRSNSGAMYLSEIDIDWETDVTTYTAYCTTVSLLPIPTIVFTNNEDEEITSLNITAQDMAEVSVTCLDENDEPMDVTLSINSSDDAIAEYDEGYVMAYKSGSVTLTATFTGNERYQGTSAVLTVNVAKIVTTTIVEVEIEDTDVYTATEGGLAEATVNAGGSPIDGATVTWTSSDARVATIDSDGEITLVGVGETTITASYAGTDVYAASEGTYVLTLTSSKPQETTVNITFGNTLYGTSYSGTNAANNGPFEGTVNNVTVEVAQGSGSNLYVTNSETRIYGGTTKGTITITAPSGYVITMIEITKGSNWDVTASPGTLSTATWSGSASEVVFTASSRSDFQSATITLAVSAEVGATGWATFCSDQKLDFSGLEDIEAYIVTGYSGTTITKTQMEGTVPARTPLLLKADKEGTYAITVAANSSTDVSANKLVQGDGMAVGYAAGYLRYVLGLSASSEAEFQQLVNGGASATVAANKAYLQFEVTSGAPSALRIIDEENNATSLDKLDNDETIVKFIENGQLYILRDGVVYDALGRKLR